MYTNFGDPFYFFIVYLFNFSSRSSSLAKCRWVRLAANAVALSVLVRAEDAHSIILLLVAILLLIFLTELLPFGEYAFVRARLLLPKVEVANLLERPRFQCTRDRTGTSGECSKVLVFGGTLMHCTKLRRGRLRSIGTDMRIY